jgi:NRE family putative nickel resistance protein-like MFS transporter
MRSSTSPLVKNQDFRLLFPAQVISLTGSGAPPMGLALFAHQLICGDSAV